MNTDQPNGFLSESCAKKEVDVDLIPSDARVIAIAVVVVVLIAVVAWEYARRRAATPHKKIDSD